LPLSQRGAGSPFLPDGSTSQKNLVNCKEFKCARRPETIRSRNIAAWCPQGTYDTCAVLEEKRRVWALPGSLCSALSSACRQAVLSVWFPQGQARFSREHPDNHHHHHSNTKQQQTILEQAVGEVGSGQ
jgi:hypothetical protein